MEFALFQYMLIVFHPSTEYHRKVFGSDIFTLLDHIFMHKNPLNLLFSMPGN